MEMGMGIGKGNGMCNMQMENETGMGMEYGNDIGECNWEWETKPCAGTPAPKQNYFLRFSNQAKGNDIMRLVSTIIGKSASAQNIPRENISGRELVRFDYAPQVRDRVRPAAAAKRGPPNASKYDVVEHWGCVLSVQSPISQTLQK